MRRLAAFERGKLLRHGCHKLIVVQVAGRGEHHISAVEPVAVVAEKLLLAKPPHRLRRSQNRLAQRMTLPEALREQLVHQHVGIVFVDLDLFQNHAALALNVGQRKGRIQHHVRQHVQRNGNMV